MFNPKHFVRVFEQIAMSDIAQPWAFNEVRVDDYFFCLATFKIKFSGMDDFNQAFVLKITDTHVNVEIKNPQSVLETTHSFEIGSNTESEVVMDILNSGVLFIFFNNTLLSKINVAYNTNLNYNTRTHLVANNIVFCDAQLYKFISYVTNYKSHMGDEIIGIQLLTGDYHVIKTNDLVTL